MCFHLPLEMLDHIPKMTFEDIADLVDAGIVAIPLTPSPSHGPRQFLMWYSRQTLYFFAAIG